MGKTAGRLKLFYDRWRLLTSDRKVLSSVRGVILPFVKKPFQCVAPTEPRWSPSEHSKISSAIRQLLCIGAISEVQACKGQFLSKIFLIPKPDGKSRFIINLKQLNLFIKTDHFKMEDYRVASSLITPGCFLAKLDLQDAYFLVPISTKHRKYLRFSFDNILYEFSCLCFGLNCAPRLFTKLLKPVVAFLRAKGLISVVYLDDFLLIGKSREECLYNVHQTIKILEYLGFVVNYKKSILIPSNVCTFLGFQYNSLDMSIALPIEKKSKLKSLLQSFCNKKYCRIQEFARLLGVLVSACPAVPYGYLYSKLLEREKFLALRENKDNYGAIMKISPILIPEFHWWIDNLENKKPIKLIDFAMEIFSDASTTGWGVHCNNTSSRGFWSEDEKKHHINYLELLAVFFGLKCFAGQLKDCSILCRVDNSTAISYVNRMGSVRFPKLNDLAREIWRWCEEKHIYLLASYIPSAENVDADLASRNVEFDTEWSLADSAFDTLTQRFGFPEVDLFASRLNAKCVNYVSWLRDPEAMEINAFTVNWNKFFFYAFPPFCIILKVLQKIISEKAEGIVVVPVWPTQPWYPVFSSLLVEEPIVFQPSPKLLSFGRILHPLSDRLLLMGARLSGKRCN